METTSECTVDYRNNTVFSSILFKVPEFLILLLTTDYESLCIRLDDQNMSEGWEHWRWANNDVKLREIQRTVPRQKLRQTKRNGEEKFKFHISSIYPVQFKSYDHTYQQIIRSR